MSEQKLFEDDPLFLIKIFLLAIAIIGVGSAQVYYYKVKYGHPHNFPILASQIPQNATSVTCKAYPFTLKHLADVKYIKGKGVLCPKKYPYVFIYKKKKVIAQLWYNKKINRVEKELRCKKVISKPNSTKLNCEW